MPHSRAPGVDRHHPQAVPDLPHHYFSHPNTCNTFGSTRPTTHASMSDSPSGDNSLNVHHPDSRSMLTRSVSARFISMSSLSLALGAPWSSEVLAPACEQPGLRPAVDTTSPISCGPGPSPCACGPGVCFPCPDFTATTNASTASTSLSTLPAKALICHWCSDACSSIFRCNAAISCSKLTTAWLPPADDPPTARPDFSRPVRSPCRSLAISGCLVGS